MAICVFMDKIVKRCLFLAQYTGWQYWAVLDSCKFYDKLL